MKYYFFVFLVFKSFLVSGQSEISSTDSIQNQIVFSIIKKVIDDNFKGLSPSKYIFHIDIKQKSIRGYGTQYSPEYQDTIFTSDTLGRIKLTEMLTMKFKTEKIIILNKENLGKINKRYFLYSELIENGIEFMKPMQGIYIHVQEPIDGWDFIPVMTNNFRKRRLGIDATPCLNSNIYVPIEIAFVNNLGNLIIKQFLYNYLVGFNSKEWLYFKFQSRSPLNICN